MNVQSHDFSSMRTKQQAKQALVKLLQDAHAGEKAAANAYFGHAYSLFIWDKRQKSEILKIYQDELHHRKRLFEMLKGLESQPRFFREVGMWCIGAVIAVLSFIGTWYIPMHGAGQLESTNIGEYEVAARLALLAGRDDLVDELLTFAEVEWDHEQYFREQVNRHFLSKWIPLWPKSCARGNIRTSYHEFKEERPSKTCKN